MSNYLDVYSSHTSLHRPTVLVISNSCNMLDNIRPIFGTILAIVQIVRMQMSESLS